MDLGCWLRSLGLERYEGAFRDNEIDERVLPNLTQEDLKEIGVGPVGHRRILLEAIAALRADTGAKSPSPDVPTTSSAPSVAPEERAERLQPKIQPHAPVSPLDQNASCLKISDDGHSVGKPIGKMFIRLRTKKPSVGFRKGRTFQLTSFGRLAST
jgi:hypothetical protein